MMASLLFQTLSNADIDWLRAVGKVHEYLPDQPLIDAGHCFEQVHFGLNGQLSFTMPYQDHDNFQEFTQPGRDAFLGSVPGLENFLSAMTVCAKTRCQVLTIDQHQLITKLAEDQDFAARFYQFHTNLLLRWAQTLLMQAKLNPTILYQINLKQASSLFAELQDSHLDWLIAVGQRHQLTSGDMLQLAYRPIEFLHIVLDGSLSLNLPTGSESDLIGVFLQQEQCPPLCQEFARIARGDVFGEMRFIQSGAGPLPMQIVQLEAVGETEVLAIPHWRMLTKLLHDAGFALGFYRVLAGLMASKFQTILAELGFLTQDATQMENSDRLLTQMARVETRFEWMVQRIQTKVVTGRNLQWL